MITYKKVFFKIFREIINIISTIVIRLEDSTLSPIFKHLNQKTLYFLVIKYCRYKNAPVVFGKQQQSGPLFQALNIILKSENLKRLKTLQKSKSKFQLQNNYTHYIIINLLCSNIYEWDAELQSIEEIFQEPWLLNLYLIVSLDSLQLYNNPEEGLKHLHYLENVLYWLDHKVLNTENFELLPYYITWCFAGSISPSIDSSLLKYQTLKIKLLQTVVEAKDEITIEPYIYKSKSTFEKIAAFRDTVDLTPEFILMKNSLNTVIKTSDFIWVCFTHKDSPYVEKKDNVPVHYLPRNNLSLSINYFRKLEVELLYYTSPASGRFFNEATYLLEKRVANKQLLLISDIISSGITNMDGFAIGKKYNFKNLQGQFSEKLICAPGIACKFFIEKNEHIKTLNLNKKIKFVSNANVFKLPYEVIDLWCKILKDVPNSEIIIMPFYSSQTMSYKPHLLNLLKMATTNNNISINRFKVLTVQGRNSVIRIMKTTHIYLDTFPYSGSTSLFDPTSLNIPMITRECKWFRGRMGSAFLKHLGISELICSNNTKYLELAIRLSKDSNYYAKISKKINIQKEILNTYNHNSYDHDFQKFQQTSLDTL